MSTGLEDRLTAALHARAELVQPEGIGHAAPQPRTPARHWRRPAVVALVAAAAAAAVAAAGRPRGSPATAVGPLPGSLPPVPGADAGRRPQPVG